MTKHKLLSFTLLILFGSVFSALLVSPSVSALTPQECFETYDGTSMNSSSSEYQEFRDDSGCNTTEICSIKSIEGTIYTIECVNPESADPCDFSSPTFEAWRCGESVCNVSSPIYDKQECADSRGVATCEDEGDMGDCAKTTGFSFGACGNENVGINCLVHEVLNFFAIAVGIAVVAGITVGGIVYSTSRGNPGGAQKGVTIITNSIIGLVLYFLLFAGVNFLIPGGILT